MKTVNLAKLNNNLNYNVVLQNGTKDEIKTIKFLKTKKLFSIVLKNGIKIECDENGICENLEHNIIKMTSTSIKKSVADSIFSVKAKR